MKFLSKSYIGLVFFILYAPILPVVLILKFALPKLWKCYSHQWRRSSSMMYLASGTSAIRSE